MSRLTDKEIQALKPKEKPYKAADGAGLYLLVQPTGARYWRMDFQLEGKRGTIAIGVYSDAAGAKAMSLVKARAERDRCRALLARGIRPVDDKTLKAGAARAEADEVRAKAKAARQERTAQAEARKVQRTVEHLTVERVAEEWLAGHAVGKTPKSVAQARQTLEDHVYPHLGKRPISSITTADILDVLGRLFDANKAETSRKLRQRLGKIWKFAVLKHYAAADVVTPVKDVTTDRLKAARIARPPGHFPSIPPAEAPVLMGLVRNYPGSPVTRAAMLLLAYSMVRTGELRGAQWAEFELEGPAPTWRVPVSRMKVKRRGDQAAPDHVVPLSRQAVAILNDLRALELDPVHLFPHSRKAGLVMSENTVLFALWELGYRGRHSGHGFRSLASTLLHEAGFDSALVEAQLAHEKADKTAAAYDRSQHLDRRRVMLQWLADALDAKSVDNVIPITAAR